MSAIESSVLSSDAYVRELLRATESSSAVTLDRRSFLKLAGVAGGGLVLAFYVGDRSKALAGTAKEFTPNAFLRIAPDDTIEASRRRRASLRKPKSSLPTGPRFVSNRPR